MKKKSIEMELKSAREKLGLTQTEMAKQMGVPFRTLQDWEGLKRHPKPMTRKGIRGILKELLDE